MQYVKGATGRIEKVLSSVARRILFDRDLDEQISQDLVYICQIDLAHILMLAERKIVQQGSAKLLLRAIRRLTAQQFAPLRTGTSFRGLFLLYENYLIETEGINVGGLLQTGRSRNDLNATLLRLRLRQPYIALISACLRLQAVLIHRAERHAEVVMPAYTHGQPAEPITYGHYLAGVAEAIRRDVDGLIDAAREIDTSPLGSGAIAGTSAPIDPSRTAELLGFTGVTINSVDGVASRDVALRLLAAMTVYGATLSRIATDLLQWLTSEFQFLSLPDELVGSSSAMPQKRNPFLLEHVQGRTASALGAFSHCIAATRNTPFTNSIAVGTEAMRPLWGALRDIKDATSLLGLVVSYAQPQPDQMLLRASEGFTTATAHALRMVIEKGVDFRSAHRSVGKMVTETLAKGFTSLEQMEIADEDALGISLIGMDPASCVQRSKFGGGPALESLKPALQSLRQSWLRHRGLVRNQRSRWIKAQLNLDDSVNTFCAPSIADREGPATVGSAHLDGCAVKPVLPK
jgi:argininosuccinate lyase